MKAHETLTTAREIISGPRQAEYGDPRACHSAIATLWNGYLSQRGYDPLSPRDVALMMLLLKVARTMNGAAGPDTYVDMAGYAAIAGELSKPE